jgi:hypothetical protein
MTTDDHDKLMSIGRSAYESIAEMVAAVKEAGDDDAAREAAEQTILEDPLSLEVRSGWVSPGVTMEPEEFQLLLSTGGPATRIVGSVNQYGELTDPRLEAQDWFLPWTHIPLDTEETEVLEAYISYFVAL